jgi:hypothetical protein
MMPFLTPWPDSRTTAFLSFSESCVFTISDDVDGPANDDANYPADDAPNIDDDNEDAADDDDAKDHTHRIFWAGRARQNKVLDQNTHKFWRREHKESSARATTNNQHTSNDKTEQNSTPNEYPTEQNGTPNHPSIVGKSL